ncbi:MAG: ribosome-binding factor A, partial [Gammaproteobacteria bacterium]|nr:ribosome-binding factor A [Gammaproteobacteria bacterium]
VPYRGGGGPRVRAGFVRAQGGRGGVYYLLARTDPDAPVGGILEGLRAAAPFLRRALGRTLTLRRVPELRFLPDRTVEEARRIEEILREVLPDSAGGSGTTGSGEGERETFRRGDGPR